MVSLFMFDSIYFKTIAIRFIWCWIICFIILSNVWTKLGLINYTQSKDIFLRNSELVEWDKDISKICIQNIFKVHLLTHLKCVVEAALWLKMRCHGFIQKFAVHEITTIRVKLFHSARSMLIFWDLKA